jgi:Asp-tRNA(Asn)/Glu-tRNA(Gln) amidotransferase A subunit family amidase
MSNFLSPLGQLQQRLAGGDITPAEIASEALTRSDSNAGRNVYLSPNKSLAHEAEALAALSVADRGPLYGVPISLKDCFDLAGHTTSCGSRFYADHNIPANEDSWIAAQIRKAGALISGKTHMHQLAYGITGQNRDFGDCLQPADASLLTGGSSSGAAASVQEGSALAAIGTDTGGSIRVPAALCGLAGFRASIDLPTRIHAPMWHGGVHLAPSFDTLGLLFRDLRDGPALAAALFNLDADPTRLVTPRIAIVSAAFLHDAESEVLEAYAAQQESLRSTGATLHEIDSAFWHDALDIFAPIQAHEAAHIQRHKLAAHAGSGYRADELNLPGSLGPSFFPPTVTIPDFSVFEPSIAERLTWGETFSPQAIAALRLRHQAFRQGMDAILTQYDLLLLPCAPTCQLRADADHSTTRARILRYTTPLSLSGLPTVTLPHPGGIGMQLASARGRDAALLDYAASLVS